ncbi:palmitoyltransferase ZDHHC18 isoform X2 [Adelges cooleyi]|uniref:palmitoyltransferase ZDHHC18 isoform X2 n=1 Tax=Adelges cooleyi TaxID=133065 RepID=UPI00217F8C40|nr:palmitoyltransferase ZDHHC18 isoform X2 [Adelges cooleyi]
MAKVTRKWEMFPGRNRFCCDGRLMMAPNAAVFYINVVLIIGTSFLFFVFDCPYLSHRVTPVIPIISGVLFLFVIGSLFKTSFTDPGIIPRATADEAAYIEKQVYISIPNNGGTPTTRPPPRTKEVIIKGNSIKLKYCVTCKIFRPPRASHCSLCNNCVENFDHHCPWVGNCVGRRNYRFFYMFIVCLSLLIIIVFIGAVLHLLYLSENRLMVDAISESPTSVIVLIITFFSCWSVIGLAGFHTFLAASNQTTNEDIKGSFASRTGRPNFNPYSRGNICANYCYVLCSPRPPSLLDRRGIVSSLVDCKSLNKSRSRDTVISNKGFETPDVPINQNGKARAYDIPLHQYGSSSMVQPDSLDHNQRTFTTSMPTIHHHTQNMNQNHTINGIKFNNSVTSLNNTFNDTGIYETIEHGRVDPALDLDDGSKAIPTNVPPLSASRLQLLQDTTMIESALDLDSLEETSSIGTGSQVKLVKNKNTL